MSSWQLPFNYQWKVYVFGSIEFHRIFRVLESILSILKVNNEKKNNTMYLFYLTVKVIRTYVTFTSAPLFTKTFEIAKASWPIIAVKINAENPYKISSVTNMTVSQSLKKINITVSQSLKKINLHTGATINKQFGPIDRMQNKIIIIKLKKEKSL